MRSYYNPRRYSMPIRLNMSVAEAEELGSTLRDSVGEWGDPEMDELARRAGRLLLSAVAAADEYPDRPYPGAYRHVEQRVVLGMEA